MHRTRRIVTIAIALGGWVSVNSAAAEFECVIQPRQVLEISSPIEGLIERVTVDRGDSVRKGQELAVINTSVEQVLAEGAKFRSQMIGATQAGASKAQLSQQRLARAKELFDQKFVSEQAVDEAANEKQLARAELKEATDNRKLAEIEYRRQLALIQLKTVRSPINGVVMERLLNVGEMVEAGVGRKAILKLAEIGTLYVETLVPAEAYRQMKVGMVGEVSPAMAEGATERALVTVIDRVLDPGSGTFGVRLELPNKDGRLLAGVRCRVSFPDLKLAAVPRPARVPQRVPDLQRPAPRPAASQ